MDQQEHKAFQVITDKYLIIDGIAYQKLERFYPPVEVREGFLTCVYDSTKSEAPLISGTNGWIHPFELEKHAITTVSYIRYTPYELLAECSLPSAEKEDAFRLSVRLAAEVTDPWKLFRWYKREFQEEETLKAGQLVNSFLPMKAAQCSRLFAPEHAASLEQMLRLALLNDPWLMDVGVRVSNAGINIHALVPVSKDNSSPKGVPQIWNE